MAGFERERGELLCDGIQLAAIAAETGTPVHVYSGAVIDERFGALDRAFDGWPHRLHYALKANATLAVVRRMRALGAGADANSSGEIQTALRAGFTPDQIVCTGVGKSRAELEHAIGLGVSAINVESPGEIERIAAIAAAHNRVARVAVRVNPDVAAGSHPHISTGHQATKFGGLRWKTVEKHDRRFYDELSARLKALPLDFRGRSVLCLAARQGSEVRAFIDSGAFAVGIDLNPGPRNRFVVVGR